MTCEVTAGSTGALPIRIFSSNGILAKSYTTAATSATTQYEGALIKYNSSGIYQFSRRLITLNEAKSAELTPNTAEALTLQFARGSSVYGVGRFNNQNATTSVKGYPVAQGTEPPSL